MGKVLTRTMAAAAGAAMLLPLAACGGSADAGKTTISFLSWDNEQIMKPFIDEFEKENPDIKSTSATRRRPTNTSRPCRPASSATRLRTCS